jgi:hypothetical protein
MRGAAPSVTALTIRSSGTSTQAMPERPPLSSNGFVLCLGIISKAAGFWGLVAALFLGPITFVAAPLYAGFAWDNWFPLVLNYGGGIAAAVLLGIGSALSNDS